MTARSIASPEFIEERVERITESGCWIWMRTSHARGYGNVKFQGKATKAHRVSWQIFHGDPGELHVLHRCDTPACVNPHHLFLGTHQDNMDDRERKGRNKPPAIPRGATHPCAKLTEENVREIFSQKGHASSIATAEKFGIKIRHVYSIWAKKTWSHLWAS